MPDLMDRSKVAAAAPGTLFVADAGALVGAAAGEGVELVVVDLGRPGVLDALAAIGTPTLGFTNHTRRDLMDAARNAGCEVMARSEFFSRLGELLGPGG
ncbi:MAG: hypothetical protein ACYDAD_11515 [Acidimicrobiales bacterium]